MQKGHGQQGLSPAWGAFASTNKSNSSSTFLLSSPLRSGNGGRGAVGGYNNALRGTPVGGSNIWTWAMLSPSSLEWTSGAFDSCTSCNMVRRCMVVHANSVWWCIVVTNIRNGQSSKFSCVSILHSQLYFKNFGKIEWSILERLHCGRPIPQPSIHSFN